MKGNKLLKRTLIIVLCLVLVLSFCGCTGLLLKIINAANTPKISQVNDDAEYLVDIALAFISQSYVNELTDEQIMEAALAGANTIMHYYDNYGYLFTPEEFYLNFYAPTDTNLTNIIGISYNQVKYCGLRIAEVLVDSPAYRADLMADDIITDITYFDGTPITYTITDNVVALATTDSAPEKTQTLRVKTTDYNVVAAVINLVDQVRLTVMRGGTDEMCYEDGTQLIISVTRGDIVNDNAPANAEDRMEYVEYYFDNQTCNTSSKTIELRSLSLLDSQQNVGYISIKQFGKTYDKDEVELNSTSVEFKKALDILKAKGCTKLVIDVQNNPGGYVDEVEKVAQYLIYANSGNTGLTVSRLVYRDGTEQTGKIDSKYDDFFANREDTSIVILTNGNSASGSEMLTGILLDYQTGIQVGTTTFGKGIAQRPIPLLELDEHDVPINATEFFTSYFTLYGTFAKYISPLSGTEIHGVGYTPTQENTITGYENQLQRAFEILQPDAE